MHPLKGIRVVEFCNIAAGPFCGMLLADMGADVVKVEKPGGDDMRTWPPLSDGYSENFASINRGKRSIVLDLKDDADLATARRLCSRADVVIENNRPGVMDRLGLGYRTISTANPKVIYGSISAFGQDGPYAQHGGFDLTIQAASGIMSITGEPDAPPVKCGVPVSDMATGLYMAFAIAAALREAAASGRGTHLDVSMLAASLGIAALQTSEFFGTGRNAPPMGSRHPRNAPYQAFRAADGYFVMAAGNNALFAKVCEVVARPDLLSRPEYANPTLRAANQTELCGELELAFAGRTASQWIAAFSAAGVPCGPIATFAEALAHPQVEHAGFVQPLTLPSGVDTRTFGSPIRFSGGSVPLSGPPPALDADRAAILAELQRD